jgi:hypothetical protein
MATNSATSTRADSEKQPRSPVSAETQPHSFPPLKSHPFVRERLERGDDQEAKGSACQQHHSQAFQSEEARATAHKRVSSLDLIGVSIPRSGPEVAFCFQLLLILGSSV